MEYVGTEKEYNDRRRCGLRHTAVLLLCAFCLLAGAVFFSGCSKSKESPTGSEVENSATADGGKENGSDADRDETAESSADAEGDSDPGLWGDAGEPEGEHHLWITETETTSREPFEVVKKADSFEGIEPDRFGTAGLLLIPDIGINVRLFSGSDESDIYNQRGVDMEDSAALLNFGGADVIGDHTDQGFAAICDSVQGETRAYIVQEDHSYREYVCVGVLDGTNEEYHLYGSDGLDYMHAVSNRYDLVMYTCLENWQHIEITLWKDVDTAVQSEYHLGG